VLLDFGAAMAVSDHTAGAYRRVAQAGLSEDLPALRLALVEAGFLSPVLLQRHGPAIDEMIGVLLRHLGRPGLFDFADRAFVEQVRRQAEPIAADRAAWHAPPAETLFVQRKVSGMALLAMRLGARLPLRDMVAQRVAACPGPD
ncbi:MAG: AarF/ABC1/UbiB kinase family protein, partial [Phenylobacterium sp.]|nr:AarF/ABC1/UbiB kinase family protein [Phenylobacterium sp.]